MAKNRKEESDKMIKRRCYKAICDKQSGKHVQCLREGGVSNEM